MMLLLCLLPEQQMYIGRLPILTITRFHAHSKSPSFQTVMTAMPAPLMPVQTGPVLTHQTHRQVLLSPRQMVRYYAMAKRQLSPPVNHIALIYGQQEHLLLLLPRE